MGAYLDFSDRVAIVTGAGGGLGRAHAMALAARRARILINDLGGSVDGKGGSANAAEVVANEISEAGGTALANNADITERGAVDDMVQSALGEWGRVDILINNAGILRDKSFAKMEIADFQKVMDVHLMGSVHATQAVWPIMREAGYGRIMMTTSSTGLYGNFGQANYGSAKMALVGLMNTLRIEGAKYNIRVNTLAPAAGTRMLDGLVPDEVMSILDPALISPGVLFLVSEEAPDGVILAAGGGGFAAARIYETGGIHLSGDALSAENIRDRFDEILDDSERAELRGAFEQTAKFLKLAADAVQK